jgi:hypothetical protein
MLEVIVQSRSKLFLFFLPLLLKTDEFMNFADVNWLVLLFKFREASYEWLLRLTYFFFWLRWLSHWRNFSLNSSVLYSYLFIFYCSTLFNYYSAAALYNLDFCFYFKDDFTVWNSGSSVNCSFLFICILFNENEDSSNNYYSSIGRRIFCGFF